MSKKRTENADKLLGHCLERLPNGRVKANVHIDHDDDGKMYLCVDGMFCVNNYIDGIRIPFSDFSETLTCFADLEKTTLLATYRKFFEPDKKTCSRLID